MLPLRLLHDHRLLVVLRYMRAIARPDLADRPDAGSCFCQEITVGIER